MYEQTLADVAKAWRNGEFEKQGGADGRRTFDVYGLNGGTSIIKAGSAVRITRFSANVSYDKAYKKLINGDILLTSGLGGIFPSDLSVGKVVEIKSDSSGNLDYAVVEPSVDFSALYEVMVITYHDGEWDSGETAGADTE